MSMRFVPIRTQKVEPSLNLIIIFFFFTEKGEGEKTQKSKIKNQK